MSSFHLLRHPEAPLDALCGRGSEGLTVEAGVPERPARLLTPRPARRGSLGALEDIADLLCCAACRSPLVKDNGDLVCVHPDCSTRFPVVNRVPVLVNEPETLFPTNQTIARENPVFDASRPRFKVWLDNLLPKLGKNFKARNNYDLYARLLLQRFRKPVVLVIGGRILGQGFEALMSRPGIRLVETDVNLGPRTQLVCDAHDLPFKDYSFDGVIIQAVLQYVVDPFRCVHEIERVLKPGGLVYAETAFMQQVVHGCYDFTRFTYLGLRRLFRRFQEIRSGPVGGPGMALAWSCHYFLRSFASRGLARGLIHAAARLTLFWLKYFDIWLIDRPRAYDAASGFFFLGERGNGSLPDRELIRFYRGAR